MSELETRRRAIADALREVMAEPLPVTAAPPPLALVNTPVHEEYDGIDPEPVDLHRIDEVDTVDDLDEPATPVVPPLERLGAMSPVAARALFGHH